MQICKNHSPGKALTCRLNWPGVGGGEAACASGSCGFLCIGYWVHCIVHPPLPDGTLRQLIYILSSSILNEKLRGWSCPRRQSVPGTGLEWEVDTASEKKPESFIWLRIRRLGPNLAWGLSFAWPRVAFAPFLAFAFSVDYVSPRPKVLYCIHIYFPVYSENSVYSTKGSQ